MHNFLRSLLVPGVVLLGTALYWFHIIEAPSVARRVPAGVVVFILVMVAIVVAREYVVNIAGRRNRSGDSESLAPMAWVRTWWRQIVMVGLSVGYYAGFSTLGFNMCNFLFLCLALPLAGLGQNRRPALALAQVVGVALSVSALFYALATIMNFDVPAGPLGI